MVLYTKSGRRIRKLPRRNSAAGSKFGRRPLVSGKSIGYRTTAMPVSRHAKTTFIPRSLTYSSFPDNFRVQIMDNFVVHRFLDSDQVEETTWRFIPETLFLDPVRMTYSDGNPHFSFQMNRLMSLYSKAQVDYVEYIIRVVDKGIVADPEAITQSSLASTGLEFASLFLSRSDMQTYPVPSEWTDYPASTLSTVIGSKYSLVHSGGNTDSVIHRHALDLAAWYKEPNSSSRQITSAYGVLAPATLSPTITWPDPRPFTPTLLMAFQNSCAADNSSTQHYTLSVSAIYHVSFSEPHLPAYGQLFPSA